MVFLHIRKGIISVSRSHHFAEWNCRLKSRAVFDCPGIFMKQGHRLKTGAERVRKSTLIIAVQELALLHSRSFRRNEDCSFSGKIRSAVEDTLALASRLYPSSIRCPLLVVSEMSTVGRTTTRNCYLVFSELPYRENVLPGEQTVWWNCEMDTDAGRFFSERLVCTVHDIFDNIHVIFLD